jgi:DNA-binding transcriptional LysR family regulator
VPQVRETLRTVEAMLATTSRFDPAATQRTFRLVASDYVVTAVLAPVLKPCRAWPRGCASNWCCRATPPNRICATAAPIC